MWELQNRAHAMFNSAYVVAPNLGPEHRDDGGVQDLFGGQSMIVGPRGQILTQQRGWTSGDSFVVHHARHRGTAPRARRQRPVQPVQGSSDGAVSRHLRQADLPEEPVPRTLPPTEGWLAREHPTRATNIETLIERGVLTPPAGNGQPGQAISDTAEKVTSDFPS